jgi:Inner membrane component of T3SS, cytoplasmic domain
MGQVIWIEILSRHRDVAERHRFEGGEVRIGRGYENDLVLDDPHVAVNHLRIRRDEAGALIAEDVGSANGLYLDRSPERQERIALDGDRVIRIGGVLLRVREPGYAVPRERPEVPARRLWPVALALAAAILAVEILSLWLAETAEVKASRYVTPVLSLAGLALGWTAVWTVLSRIFAGRAPFERHLITALAGVLAYSLYDEFAQFAAFAFSWRLPISFEYVVLWAALALVCYRHVLMLGSRRHFAALGVVVVAVLGIATQSLTQSEARADFGQGSYLRRLMPPALRLAAPRTETAFFSEVEQLKGQLDHDRQEAPATAGSP